MPDIQSTSSLMEDLYAATLDPTCWGKALESVATFIGGPGARLWLETAEIAPYLRYFNPPDFWQRQLSTDHEGEGPLHNSSGCFFAGNVTCDMAARRMEIVFCEHPVAPGWSDGTMRVLARFAVYRPGYIEGWVEPATRRMMIIFPHIRRAVEICQEIVINRAASAAFEDTLDGMDAGVFLVNALGQMVGANSNGDAMLKQGRLVGSARGELIAYKRKTVSLPGKSYASGNGRGAGHSGMDALEPDAEIDSKHYVARPFPISTTGDGMDGGGRIPVAGVILREATLPVDETVEKISRHFRLADRQRQVLQAIVDGSSLTEIAEKLAITPSTTKTYLQRLLEKTGTKSQTDLIKLCAAFRSPFAGASDAR
jgi:DNA-binding CsgD family transcriptional regulator